MKSFDSFGPTASTVLETKPKQLISEIMTRVARLECLLRATMKNLSYEEVQQEWPDAWEKLGEQYRQDNLLEFFTIGNNLFRRPLESQEKRLGVWVSQWDIVNGYWT